MPRATGRLTRLDRSGPRDGYVQASKSMRHPPRHNVGMSFFYGFMLFVMAATLLPSVFYLGLYLFTGVDEALERAAKLWNFMRAFTLMGFNVTLWGHVAVGLWSLVR